MDAEACYRALAARDSRFDGRFFVGVASTGIYCRPVCPAKLPKRENCTFYGSAARAEGAGFRPCLRCRPELAPGIAPETANVDAIGMLAREAARRIEAGALDEMGLEELARDLGVSSRHLRRAFAEEWGVGPHAMARTRRLLSAKRLLRDTALPIAEVAAASGYASLRRFQAEWRERYAMAPSEMRRAAHADETVTTRLAFRPPLDWPRLLAFLETHATPGIEAVREGAYERNVVFRRRDGREAVGRVRATREEGAAFVRLEVSASLAPGLTAIVRRMRRLLDLDADPEAIGAAIGPLAEARPGLRVPGAFDPFELAVRTILGQLVSVRAGSMMAGRLAARFGRSVDGMLVFPGPGELAAAPVEEIAGIGIPRVRAGAIQALARSGLKLAPGSDPRPVRAGLLALPGVGPWTAEYVLMRGIGWPDAFPETDLVLARALARLPVGASEAWRPWRAYAAMHLWATETEPITPETP